MLTTLILFQNKERTLNYNSYFARGFKHSLQQKTDSLQSRLNVGCGSNTYMACCHVLGIMTHSESILAEYTCRWTISGFKFQLIDLAFQLGYQERLRALNRDPTIIYSSIAHNTHTETSGIRPVFLEFNPSESWHAPGTHARRPRAPANS